MAANPAPQLHPREELDQKHLQVVEKDPLDALLKEGTLSEANLTRCATHAEKLYREPELVALTIDFSTTTGAMVVYSPTEDEIAAGDTFQFALRPTDKVYPICHEGVNRSQVAFLVLQGLMRKVGNHMHNVVAPHGAETGFDPHAGYTNVSGENYYEFTHGAMLGPEAPSEWQHRCFLKAFGFAKTKRFGHEVGSSLPLNPTEDNMVRDDYTSVLKARLHMRGFFEHNFYGNNFKYLPTGLKPSPDKPPTPLDTRRVFVCFMRSAPIIMRRLMETRDKLGVDVSNVVVVAIPWKDTISSACSRANIDAARAAGDVHADKESVTVAAYRDLFARIARLLVITHHDPLVLSGRLIPASPTPAHSAPVQATSVPHTAPGGASNPDETANPVVGPLVTNTGAGAGAGAGSGSTPRADAAHTPVAAVVPSSAALWDSPGGGNPAGSEPATISVPAVADEVPAAPPTAPPAVTLVVRRGDDIAPPEDANPNGFKRG